MNRPKWVHLPFDFDLVLAESAPLAACLALDEYDFLTGKT
jgi:hypothetical protein